MRVLCRRTNKEYTKYCLAYSLFQSPSSVWRTTLEWLKEEHATIFQSTSSVWRTTANLRRIDAMEPISIHVLRVEDDKVALKIWRCRLHFNPRPPCGGRLIATVGAAATGWISIHVLRVEDDRCI